MNTAPVVLDPDLGDPMAQQLRRDRAAGQLGSTHQALAASRDGAWDRRWLYLSRIDRQDPRPPFEAGAQMAPQDPLAYLLRGAHSLACGSFEAAEQDLRYAAQLDPADPTPYALLLRTDAALGRGEEQLARDFAEARAREPAHLPAHLARLEALLASGPGGGDRALAFAREASEGAPNGSELYALVAAAHLARRAALFSAGDSLGGASYLKVAATQTELNTAYARSLGSPLHQARWWTFLARNRFAYLFFLLPDPFRLKKELEAIQQAFDPSAWGDQLGQAGDLILQARQVAAGQRLGGGAGAGAGASPVKRALSGMGPLNIFRLGVAAVGLLVVLGVGVYQGIQGLRADRESVVFFVNAGQEPMRYAIDGESYPALAAGEHGDWVFEPGTTHQVRAWTDSGFSEEGSFTVPERPHLWSDGAKALYDLSGQGRYVSATVPYGSGARPTTTLVGQGQRFWIFPEGFSEYIDSFPSQISGNATTLYGICRVDPSSGEVPCLR